jgi:hypothetical protein
LLVEDWLLYLKSVEGKYGDEFDLSQLSPGDLLKVVTQHTDYLLTIVDGRYAELVCSRPDRPMGRVLIKGCTFGRSSSIKPGHLFCGGNLEFSYEKDSKAMTHTTTAIKAIYWRVSRSEGPDRANQGST